MRLVDNYLYESEEEEEKPDEEKPPKNSIKKSLSKIKNRNEEENQIG